MADPYFPFKTKRSPHGSHPERSSKRFSQQLTSVTHSASGEQLCGSVEMFFDRGERFMRTIYGPWQRHRNKSGSLKLIHKIEQARSEDFVGIQAADFLAWHTNRDWWKRDVGEQDLLLRMRMIATGLFSSDRYDYAKLMARYRDWPARDPHRRVPRQ